MDGARIEESDVLYSTWRAVRNETAKVFETAKVKAPAAAPSDPGPKPVAKLPTRTWTKEGGLEVHHSDDPKSAWPKWAREAAEEGRKVYHSAYEPQRRSDERSWVHPHGRRGPWIER